MKYEIEFYYYSKLPDNQYDLAEQKKYVKKIKEGATIENVASVVLLQFARRDILVADVKVYEFARKEISFKETKSGIIIKNKKFNISDSKLISSEEFVEEDKTETSPQAKMDISPSSAIAQKPIQPVAPPKAKYEKYEIFNPKTTYVDFNSGQIVTLPSVVEDLKKQGKMLTQGKEYGIVEEVVAGPSLDYVIDDDEGRRIRVDCAYFEVKPVILKHQNMNEQQYMPNLPRQTVASDHFAIRR